MKRFFLILSVCVFTSSVSAQQFGLKFGTSLASVYGSDVEDEMEEHLTVFNPGILIGGFMRTGSDDLGGIVELVYNQKGFKLSDDDEYYRVIHNYLDMNYMVKYFISDQVSLNGGGGIGYFISGKSVEGDDGDKDSDSYDSDDMEDFNKIDLAINIGTTFYLNELMNIDLRYSLGLIKIHEDADIFNKSIQISLSYIFDN